MILTVTLNPSIDKLYLVDALRPHEVMRVREVHRTAGGKGMNVSRVAALAGEQVTAMGFVGGGAGRVFESLIRNRNITPAFTRTNAETRSCINIRDGASGESTELLEPGSPVTEDDVARFLNDYEARLPLAQVVTISGSMPPGVPQNFYAVLVELAKRAGKPVLLDTSGAALRAALPAGPTLVKPNADELRQLLRTDAENRRDLVRAARRLHEGGVAVAAVSLGGEGVLVACREGVYRGVTPDIPVVNTVGSGDSMVAGFAVGMARGMPVEECIRFAVAVSTANTQTKQTGFYTQEDFRRIEPLVRVEREEGSL